jgi:hypothetical protein
MLESLTFYNWYGAGDLFNSREFVKELMQKIPAKRYIYRHSKNPRIFEDIPTLEHGRINDKCHNGKSFIRDDDNLYINTWIGRDSSYVLPGIGCTIRMNYKMYNDILADAKMDVKLHGNFFNYIPIIDFTKINTLHIMRINEFNQLHKDKRLILWVTSQAQSAQSENFDFWPAVNEIAKQYSDYIFLVTDPYDAGLENVIYTGDIIKSEDGFDLNEIAYLSRSTDTIIGRPTGPFTFAQIKENMLDENKALLGFSYHINSLNFAQAVNTPINKYWSNDKETDLVVKHVRTVLER